MVAGTTCALPGIKIAERRQQQTSPLTTTPVRSRVKPNLLTDQVFDALRSRIARGEWALGEHMTDPGGCCPSRDERDAAYASTKSALLALSKAAVGELGPQGIRVNTVHPGGVATDIVVDGGWTVGTRNPWTTTL